MYFIGWVGGGREGSTCSMGSLLLDIGPLLSCHLSPYITFNLWIIFYLLYHKNYLINCCYVLCMWWP